MFFSDAVIAIAMPLLALELPVPDADTVDGLLRQLGDNLAEYAAFLCSYFVIGVAWSSHHHLFDFVGRIDYAVLGHNLQWLFLIVVMLREYRYLRRCGLLTDPDDPSLRGWGERRLLPVGCSRSRSHWRSRTRGWRPAAGSPARSSCAPIS